MRAGELRHRITIQETSPTRSARGAEVDSWSDVAEVWASVEPESGKEFFESQGRHAEVTHRIKMRYRSGITPKMRVKFGSRHFDINSIVNPDERNRELIMMCTEQV